MGEHLIAGRFKSDRHPGCPEGKVPVSTRDPLAQDLLWELARRYDAVELEFADDLRQALTNDGYAPVSLAMGDKPKIIVLCGSSRFVDVMAVCAWILERDELAIAMGLHLLPGWYPNLVADHLAEAEDVAEAMDALHLRKIELADAVFVVDVDGYIGESCSNEIRHAQAGRLPIRYFTTDSVGSIVRDMMAEARRGDMEAQSSVNPGPSQHPDKDWRR